MTAQAIRHQAGFRRAHRGLPLSFNKIEQRSRNITLSRCQQRAYDAFIRRQVSP
ncbi:hypothetical protein DDI_2321 [Dickeya dianthicola RNS04.9]|nr:hypothetical protein DDI_2321 [Dickeya dianthicola RNS04.9]